MPAPTRGPLYQKVAEILKNPNVARMKERESIQWMRDNFQQIRRMPLARKQELINLMQNPEQFLNMVQVKRAKVNAPPMSANKVAGYPLFGTLNMYLYDAKTKDRLYLWDRYPLVLPVDHTPTGWTGLNLHYLPVPDRLHLLDRLKVFADDQRMNFATRLNISYELLKSVERLGLFRECFKQYRLDHLRSAVGVVHPRDWEYACYLPVATWVKGGKFPRRK